MKTIKLSVVVAAMLISACGFNGDQKVSVNDSNHNININMTFINQLVGLCQDKNLQSDFATYELWKQAVANCVFDNMSILNVANSPLCKPGADLSHYTPDQQQQILAACAAMGQ